MSSIAAAPNSFVAAATRLTTAPPVRKTIRSRAGWAADAWNFYDTIGEFRYAADWKGSMISKARLFVADENDRPVTSGPAYEVLNALFGGPDRQPEMLKAFGTHLTVAGDCYLLGAVVKGQDNWRVVASSSISARGGSYQVNGKPVESSADPFLMRLWQPHPLNYNDANSPTRAVLPILAEIDGLTRHVASQIDSRLAGAGVLMLPSEMTFPATPVTQTDLTVDPDGGSGASSMEPVGKASEFIRQLGEVMSQAIAEPESASARVPIVVTAPGDQIGNSKLLTFWSNLDEHAIELRTEAIRRLALGLDMPPEVLTGIADTNHWNAWAIDESAIKVHAEPTLELICASLTEGYLQPVLAEDIGEDQAARFTVQADTSGIRLRPNRSQESIELYDRGELSSEALRRETGFDPEDAPNNRELVTWLIRKVAGGSTTPELVAEALRVLGAPLDTPQLPAQPTQAPSDRSLKDHPGNNPPQAPPTEAPVGLPASAADLQHQMLQHQVQLRQIHLLASSEQMVYRALERAGNRMKSKLNGSRPPGVCAADLYLYVPCSSKSADDLLTDAWSHVSRFATGLGVQSDRLTAALDAYCRVLLTEQREHDPVLLGKYLEQVGS